MGFPGFPFPGEIRTEGLSRLGVSPCRLLLLSRVDFDSSQTAVVVVVMQPSRLVGSVAGRPEGIAAELRHSEKGV